MLSYNKPKNNILKLNPIQNQAHPYHLLEPSILPAATSIAIGIFLGTLALTMHEYEWATRALFLHVSGLLFIVTVLAWFFSIIRESRQGYHTRLVQQGLRMGMVLFIASEVMFFFAFFWSFFHYTLSPSVNVGTIWPPAGIQNLDIWHLPLGNTILLLLSGVTITAAHAFLLEGQKDRFGVMLGWTIVLGLVFLICQGFEYKYGVNFTWRDSVQGSVFFVTTGFHGLHVTIGTVFLAVCFVRHIVSTPSLNVGTNQWGFEADHHFGFEAAAWYWHFVDVVWLFLFITVYWWGSAVPEMGCRSH